MAGIDVMTHARWKCTTRWRFSTTTANTATAREKMARFQIVRRRMGQEGPSPLLPVTAAGAASPSLSQPPRIQPHMQPAKTRRRLRAVDSSCQIWAASGSSCGEHSTLRRTILEFPERHCSSPTLISIVCDHRDFHIFFFQNFGASGFVTDCQSKLCDIDQKADWTAQGGTEALTGQTAALKPGLRRRWPALRQRPPSTGPAPQALTAQLAAPSPASSRRLPAHVTGWTASPSD